MCQATVYLGDKEIAREVTWLEPTDEGVRLATFFEEPRTVPGRILHIDFLKHHAMLESLEGQDGGNRETAGVDSPLDRAQR